MPKKRIPGFGEGFASTFSPTLNDVMMQTMRDLAQAPEKKQEMEYRGLSIEQKRRELAGDGDVGSKRVLLTSDILKTLPSLEGLGLEGKDISVNELVQLRKAGRVADPVDQFKVFVDLTTGTKGLDLQTQNPELYNRLSEKRNALAVSTLGVDLSGSKKKTAPQTGGARRIRVDIGGQVGTILESDFNPKTMKKM